MERASPVAVRGGSSGGVSSSECAPKAKRDSLNAKLTARLRKFFGNRRRSPRYEAVHEVRLTVGVIVVDTAHQTKALTGHTRNISAEGLLVVVPNTSTEDLNLAEDDRLIVALVLPTRTLTINATAVHWELLDEQKPQKGCILGVRITEMESSDRKHFLDYLSTLH